MKLVFCPYCSDVFKLDYDMRQCKCGKVKGRYKDNVNAEVSKDAISLAIGNGALLQAIVQSQTHQFATDDEAPRQDYYKRGQGKIDYAWVRPNTGPGNPHTQIIEEDKQ
jgi:hypothetical protein